MNFAVYNQKDDEVIAEFNTLQQAETFIQDSDPEYSSHYVILDEDGEII